MSRPRRHHQCNNTSAATTPATVQVPRQQQPQRHPACVMERPQQSNRDVSPCIAATWPQQRVSLWCMLPHLYAAMHTRPMQPAVLCQCCMMLHTGWHDRRYSSGAAGPPGQGAHSRCTPLIPAGAADAGCRRPQSLAVNALPDPRRPEQCSGRRFAVGCCLPCGACSMPCQRVALCEAGPARAVHRTPWVPGRTEASPTLSSAASPLAGETDAVGQPALMRCHAHSDSTSATRPQQRRRPPLCRRLDNNALSGTLPASWSALRSASSLGSSLTEM
jgi:hypothetical protein